MAWSPNEMCLNVTIVTLAFTKMFDKIQHRYANTIRYSVFVQNDAKNEVHVH